MRLLSYLVIVFSALASAVAHSADMEGYSTILRVEFVLECMRDREGSQYELMNKCSCVLDQLGQIYSADEFVDARTTAKAITISGERGAALRDNKQAQELARKHEDSVKQAETDCFLR
jgi:ATP/maltotriose-dependent transcriptional regulator MalT